MKYSLWIARDKDGTLYLYGFRPARRYDTWYDWDDGSRYNIIELDKTLFPETTWESEPIEVILSLKPLEFKLNETIPKTDIEVKKRVKELSIDDSLGRSQLKKNY